MIDEIESHNAGYHRGLNTEYHGTPVEELFEEWISDFGTRRRADLFRKTTDLASFTEGFEQGRKDYGEGS